MGAQAIPAAVVTVSYPIMEDHLSRGIQGNQRRGLGWTDQYFSGRSD